MVTVEYSHMGRAYTLRISGHAGTAPKGKDLVCSAVSILASTAAQRVLELYCGGLLTEWPTAILSDGSALVAAVADAEQPESAAQAFETVMTGFRLLAQQYPKCVSIMESSA